MIYIDGGSNTYGDEIEQRETNAWPFILGNKLGIPVVNQAIKGKSNQHIVFDVLNFCAGHRPTAVVIGWVNLSRRMFVRGENNFLIDISPSGQNSIYQDQVEFKKFQTLLYKYWSNFLYDAWHFLHQVILVQRFLQSQHIPYFMFNDADSSNISKLLTISQEHSKIKDKLLDAFDLMTDDNIQNVETKLNELYRLIDHDNFYNFSWHISKIVKFSRHPSVSDHRILADFFLPLVQTRI